MIDNQNAKTLHALVVVVSDSVSSGQAADESGQLLVQGLTDFGFSCEKSIVPDEIEPIRLAVGNANADLVVTTGGTGVSPRDVTPEAVAPLIEKRLPGVEEAYRAYGLAKTPNAMLSRSLAGMRGKTLILCLPGSPKAVRDALDCLFPTVLHVFEVAEGKRHSQG